jgi:hypothetical protein
VNALGRWLLLGVFAALLVGCRDSPREVMEASSEAAARGDLVALEGTFSVSTVQRLERSWAIASTPKARGWQVLAERLTFDAKALEILDETIHGEYARVMARAGATERDYYLRKEDGEWRIELGAGLRFRRAGPKDEGEGAPAEGATPAK